MRLFRHIKFVLLLWVLLTLPAEAALVNADSLLSISGDLPEMNRYPVTECYGRLYVKQHTNLKKWNVGLNMIPGMTRFDRDENHYLTELFYDVHFLEHAMPTIYRRAYLTTHRRGNGEMDRVLCFMTPAVHTEKLFAAGYLSPLHSSSKGYYRYELDTMYSDTVYINKELRKVCYRSRYDNIKLLSRGWFLLDDSSKVREFYAEGWDEQCRFKVHYRMGEGGLREYLVRDVELQMHYKFAGYELEVKARGVYDYDEVQSVSSLKREEKYDITASHTSMLESGHVADMKIYAEKHRQLPLSPSDYAFYVKKNVFKKSRERVNEKKERGVAELLWTLGDQMISSHSIDWRGGNMRLSPIIAPSHLSYSSSRGLSYKMTLNLRSAFKNGKSLTFKPMVGYSFKQNDFYWDVDGNYCFDPKNLGVLSLDVGSGNRTYSSVVVDRIKKMSADSLDFDEMNLDYFRNLYAKISLQREISNGLEFLLGVNFNRRKLIGNISGVNSDIPLKDTYSQFAPHLRLTWQPGMYYYIKDGRKVNVGSLKPRFSWDIEQGIRGVFGSTDVYTRSELDIQHKMKVGQCDALYLRVGGGGFFHTKNVYFVDYTFLRHNYLPLDRETELGGAFQLLASEWYNSANKYFRAHATYLSPFLVLQRAFPHVKFIESESLYFNALVMSHLTPYTEIGYGVSTPYIDLGVFVSGKNHQFHQFGYKITVSLFR